MGGHNEAVAGLSDRNSLCLAKVLEFVDEAGVLPRAHLAHDLAAGNRRHQGIGNLGLGDPASCEIAGVPLNDVLQSPTGITGLEEDNPSIGGAPDADNALWSVLHAASCEFLKQFPPMNAYPNSN